MEHGGFDSDRYGGLMANAPFMPRIFREISGMTARPTSGFPFADTRGVKAGKHGCRSEDGRPGLAAVTRVVDTPRDTRVGPIAPSLNDSP